VLSIVDTTEIVTSQKTLLYAVNCWYNWNRHKSEAIIVCCQFLIQLKSLQVRRHYCVLSIV